MITSDLQTIPVNKLELGMTIHGIAEQAGKLAVKQIGKVAHLSIIDQLSAHGVISVIVESKKSSSILAKLKQQKERIASNKARKQTADKQVDSRIGRHDIELASKQKMADTDDVFNQAATTEFKNRTEVSLSQELTFASQLIKQSYTTHHVFTENVKNGVGLDLAPVTKLSIDIYDSLIRNPSALLSMSMMLNSTKYLSSHAIHVAILMCYFAQQMEMSEADCKRLTVLGYIFDIGMAKIPQDILSKRSELTPREEEIIRLHVQYSLELVEPLNLERDLMMAIEQHHERLLGEGYPNGFSGAKIHKFSRMLAIVDCYDSLTSEQKHRPAQSPASALKLLTNPENGYDTKLALRFIRALGVYPIGSLVLLSNKRLALVIKNNVGKPRQPVVKVFYSVSQQQYINPQTINLATAHNELTVQKPVLAEHYNVNVEQTLLIA